MKTGGKYWHMDYTHANKRKTLALGVYPAVSLAKARERRGEARKLLADGIDPNEAKRQAKQFKLAEAANTFEAVARNWLAKTAANRAEITQTKVAAWLEKDVYPAIGKMPISQPSGHVMFWRYCAKSRHDQPLTVPTALNRSPISHPK